MKKHFIEEQCPVCGYYCLGKGGMGCIDKPIMKNIKTVDKMLKLTDEEIDKIVEEYANTKSCKEWGHINHDGKGFNFGMKYLRDLISAGIKK